MFSALKKGMVYWRGESCAQPANLRLSSDGSMSSRARLGLTESDLQIEESSGGPWGFPELKRSLGKGEEE